MSRLPHTESHTIDRVGWLRAAVLGANDGILSTSSIIVGVAASSAGQGAVITAGVAALAAGALSMAAGEYVSVSSQADTERADLERERRELADDPESELAELTAIYEDRGLSHALALQVAQELTAKDALAAHARDELGIVAHLSANPLQAAVTSAATFAVGALIPLATALLSPTGLVTPVTVAVTIVGLGVLGALGGWAGGAGYAKPAARVVLWGVIAMAVTYGIGALVGQSI